MRGLDNNNTGKESSRRPFQVRDINSCAPLVSNCLLNDRAIVTHDVHNL